MMIGAGHIIEFNKRIKQNLALLRSRNKQRKKVITTKSNGRTKTKMSIGNLDPRKLALFKQALKNKRNKIK